MTWICHVCGWIKPSYTDSTEHPCDYDLPVAHSLRSDRVDCIHLSDPLGVDVACNCPNGPEPQPLYHCVHHGAYVALHPFFPESVPESLPPLPSLSCRSCVYARAGYSPKPTSDPPLVEPTPSEVD